MKNAKITILIFFIASFFVFSLPDVFAQKENPEPIYSPRLSQEAQQEQAQIFSATSSQQQIQQNTKVQQTQNKSQSNTWFIIQIIFDVIFTVALGILFLRR